jgi:hypothetical protein
VNKATLELEPILVAPASTIAFKPLRSRTPPEAFTPMSGPTVFLINATSSTVAPYKEKPVDVLTKSAPAFTANSHARTFSSSVNKHASIMTLTNAFPFAASTTARISRSTSSSFLSFL